jgi:hypothetical protein
MVEKTEVEVPGKDIYDCSVAIIDALNQFPHPAVQMLALSLALGTMLSSFEGNDLSKEPDVKDACKTVALRAFDYWEGITSGRFEKKQ